MGLLEGCLYVYLVFDMVLVKELTLALLAVMMLMKRRRRMVMTTTGSISWAFCVGVASEPGVLHVIVYSNQ